MCFGSNKVIFSFYSLEQLRENSLNFSKQESSHVFFHPTLGLVYLVSFNIMMVLNSLVSSERYLSVVLSLAYPWSQPKANLLGELLKLTLSLVNFNGPNILMQFLIINLHLW